MQATLRHPTYLLAAETLSGWAATVLAWIVGLSGIGAALLGWKKGREKNALDLQKSEISANTNTLKLLSSRIESLERLCVEQQREINSLNESLLKYAIEGEQLKAKNAELTRDNEELQKAHDEAKQERSKKHEIGGELHQYKTGLIAMMLKTNHDDQLANREPRFSDPLSGILKVDEMEKYR